MATVTRGEADLLASAGQRSEDSTVFSRKRSLSQSSEDPDQDLEQGEIRPRDEHSPAYADTLETIKKWLHLEVRDEECLVPPSVFSGRDQVKRSVYQSMALPIAQLLVESWKYKEFTALGSNEVDDNDHHHPPMSKGQFLTFPKPQMKFYLVYHSISLCLLQDYRMLLKVLQLLHINNILPSQLQSNTIWPGKLLPERLFRY